MRVIDVTLPTMRGLPVSSSVAIPLIEAHHVAFGLDWKLLGTHDMPVLRRQD
jgi:hypothetical protein